MLVILFFRVPGSGLSKPERELVGFQGEDSNT
jgi:hypothetical protein